MTPSAMLGEILTAWGLQVRRARGGVEALREAERFVPDVAPLDRPAGDGRLRTGRALVDEAIAGPQGSSTSIG